MLLKVVEMILLCLYAFINIGSSQGTIELPNNVSVSAVLAFGDSFVDQGNNDYINTLGKANFLPYGKDFMGGNKPTGRFSNGKTIADIFANALGVKEYLPASLDPSLQDEDLLTGVSFASGGSGYDPQTTNVTSAIPLSDQLDMFKEYIEKLNTNIGEEATTNLITNSEVLVVASTNDWLLYFALPVGRKLQYDVPSYNKFLVNSAMDFVQEIYKLGARRIVVFSAPPVGCFPAVRTLSGGLLRTCYDEENEAIQLYNTLLKEQLQSLETNLSESRIAFVDFYNPLITAIENPQQYGLEVTDRGCCGTGLIEVVGLCNELVGTCSDDSKYFFWDSIHLSEKGCYIFANQTLPDLVNTLFYSFKVV